jgi:hypothetical protein
VVEVVEVVETDPTVDPLLVDAPDTTTGKHQLMENDEGRPGPGV